MKRLTLSLLALVILLPITLITVAPHIINLQNITNYLINKLESDSEITFDPETEFSLFPTPTIHLKNLRTKTPGHTTITTHIDNLNIALEWLPLLTKQQYVINYIEAIKPHITITKSTQPRTRTQHDDTPPDSTDNTKTSDINIEQIHLEKGRITYKTSDGLTALDIIDLNLTSSLRENVIPLKLTTTITAPDIPALPVTIIGNIKTDETMGNITLENTEVEIKNLAIATLNINIDRNPPTPYITGTALLDHINLTSLTPTPTPNTSNTQNAPETTTKAQSDPIDITALSIINTKLEGTVRTLKAPNLEIGNLTFKANISNGNANLELTSDDLYGGTISTKLNIQNPTDPTIQTTLALNNLNLIHLHPIINDIKAFEGVLTLNTNLRTSGTTAEIMLQKLTGSGNLAITDGKIKHFNLINLLQNNLINSDKNSTHITEATASYTIKHGIIHNHDLNLHTQQASVTGEGSIDMPQKHLSYKLTPIIHNNTTNREAEKSFYIPLTIKGPFDKLEYLPDLTALTPNTKVQETIETIIKDPTNAKSAIETLKDGFKKDRRNIKENLNNLQNIIRGF